MSDEQYCLNVLLRVDGYTCEECNYNQYSLKCKLICKNVEVMIG